MADITATIDQTIITATVTNVPVSATASTSPITATVSSTDVSATVSSTPVTATLLSGGTITATVSSSPITATLSAGLEEAPQDGTPYSRQDADWVAAGVGAGDVVGPASAVDGNFAAFDTTTGKLIKDSLTGASSFLTAETDPVYLASQAANITLQMITDLGNLSGANSGDVTIGTANGLSLASQALSLAAAASGTAGALTGTDWDTFNAKQAALTFGIANTNAVLVNGTGVNGQVAQWTASGITAAALIAPASNVLTLTNSAASTLALAITASKTLTLTAADDYNVTFPATGTVALGTGVANRVGYWSGVNTLTGAAGFTYNPAASPNFFVQAANAAHVAGVFKSAVSQTANLTE